MLDRFYLYDNETLDDDVGAKAFRKLAASNSNWNSDLALYF